MMYGTHVTLTHCNMMHGTHNFKLILVYLCAFVVVITVGKKELLQAGS